MVEKIFHVLSRHRSSSSEDDEVVRPDPLQLVRRTSIIPDSASSSKFPRLPPRVFASFETFVEGIALRLLARLGDHSTPRSIYRERGNDVPVPWSFTSPDGYLYLSGAPSLTSSALLLAFCQPSSITFPRNDHLHDRSLRVLL